MTRRAQQFFGFMLMALFMRLLVPDGYMLEATGQGLGIVLCNGSGSARAVGAHAVHSGHHHSDRGSGHSDGQHSVCPYAALAAPSSPPPPPFAIAPPSALPALAPVVLAASRPVGPGLAAPPPPATGPPSA